MSLTLEQVQATAHLARLAMSDDECRRQTDELGGILDLVERMNSVDTTEVAPMAHPQHACQRLRPDAVTVTDRRARYQALAPAVERGLYLVPRVVE